MRVKLFHFILTHMLSQTSWTTPKTIDTQTIARSTLRSYYLNVCTNNFVIIVSILYLMFVMSLVSQSFHCFPIFCTFVYFFGIQMISIKLICTMDVQSLLEKFANRNLKPNTSSSLMMRAKRMDRVFLQFFGHQFHNRESKWKTHVVFYISRIHFWKNLRRWQKSEILGRSFCVMQTDEKVEYYRIQMKWRTFLFSSTRKTDILLLSSFFSYLNNTVCTMWIRLTL